MLWTLRYTYFPITKIENLENTQEHKHVFPFSRLIFFHYVQCAIFFFFHFYGLLRYFCLFFFNVSSIIFAFDIKNRKILYFTILWFKSDNLTNSQIYVTSELLRKNDIRVEPRFTEKMFLEGEGREGVREGGRKERII